MKPLNFKFLKPLIFVSIILSLLGFGWAKAQDSSFRITDSKGREVIVYKESHALVIWAGNYQYWDKLKNIENEANDVKAALERQGFKVKIVANPTGDILNSEIKKFINSYGYQTDNRLVFYFAGHGVTRQKTKGYFVPIDAPDPAVNPQSEQDFLSLALSMEEVETWSKRIEAKHVLFVFDSCFSGTIFKQRSNFTKQSYIEAIMNKPVREFLTAGDADQRVPAKSVFTPLFIRALEGKADLYEDGYITGNELGLYLRQNLGDYTKEQTPQFGTIRDPELDQGDIVFRALNTSEPVANSSPSSATMPSFPEIKSKPSPSNPTSVNTLKPKSSPTQPSTSSPKQSPTPNVTVPRYNSLYSPDQYSDSEFARIERLLQDQVGVIGRKLIFGVKEQDKIKYINSNIDKITLTNDRLGIKIIVSVTWNERRYSSDPFPDEILTNTFSFRITKKEGVASLIVLKNEGIHEIYGSYLQYIENDLQKTLALLDSR